MQQHLRHFGNQLYRLRKRAGMTQGQLAARLGVTQGYIAKLEGIKEERHPTIDFLLSVSNLFDVGIDDLLGTQKNGALLPPDELGDLPELFQAPVRQFIKHLTQAARTEQFELHSSSVRTIGPNLAAEVEGQFDVNVAPKIAYKKIVPHPIQDELFHTA